MQAGLSEGGERRLSERREEKALSEALLLLLILLLLLLLFLFFYIYIFYLGTIAIKLMATTITYDNMYTNAFKMLFRVINNLIMFKVSLRRGNKSAFTEVCWLLRVEFSRLFFKKS